MAKEGDEGPTTLDVPSLNRLHEWRAEAERAGELAPITSPERAPPERAPEPPAATSAEPMERSETAPDGGVTDAPMTDWMSPDEVDAALSAGKPRKERRPAAAPRTPHATPRRPAWVVPLIAAASFVILLGSVLLVILLGGH